MDFIGFPVTYVSHPQKARPILRQNDTIRPIAHPRATEGAHPVRRHGLYAQLARQERVETWNGLRADGGSDAGGLNPVLVGEELEDERSPYDADMRGSRETGRRKAQTAPDGPPSFGSVSVAPPGVRSRVTIGCHFLYL